MPTGEEKAAEDDRLATVKVRLGVAYISDRCREQHTVDQVAVLPGDLIEQTQDGYIHYMGAIHQLKLLSYKIKNGMY